MNEGVPKGFSLPLLATLMAVGVFLSMEDLHDNERMGINLRIKGVQSYATSHNGEWQMLMQQSELRHTSKTPKNQSLAAQCHN